MPAPPSLSRARPERPAFAFDSTHGEPWRLRCPECGARAFAVRDDVMCPSEGRRIGGCDGVLILMRAERMTELAPFLEAYRRVRRSEGWGGDAEYYRRLPFDSGGRHAAIWRLRARSYRAALRAIETRFPDAKRSDEQDKLALRILEVGAGNAWFSWRMAERGHTVLATDISLDEEDGLLAFAHYAWPHTSVHARLTRARAEMEELPLEDAQCDVVVANGALHYASSVPRAIDEARRVLRPGGIFLVLDSPVYPSHEAGGAMVSRRDDDHRKRFGLAPAATTTGFLVERPFRTALEGAGFTLTARQPFEGLVRRLRRGYCALRRFHPPARFPVFVGEKRA